MRNLRNLLATFTLVVVLLVTASTAKAGLLVSDLTGGNTETPCSETKVDTKINWGVIINGFTGVIINGFTGVIINDITDTNTNCGVIING